MGKGVSKPTQTIDLSLNHPKFTNAKFKVNEKQRFMQTIIGIDNKQYDKWKDRFQKNKPNPEFLLLPVSEDFMTKGLCGNTGTLILDFEDFPYLLTEEIAHRKGKKKLFEENQLWYLLFTLISAKKDMVPSFTKIGDVRPDNIFINSQGEVKISNVYSWPHENTNFMKTFDNEVTYLAPQELKQLAMAVPESLKNDQSEIFSIGLTLLSAATLDDFLDAYNLKDFYLNEGRINQRLNDFKLNPAYSDIFKGVVCNLCEFNEQNRINAEELWNWISPHQQKIRSKQNFFIPSAPNKIHQEVGAVRKSISLLLGSARDSGYSPSVVRSSIPEIYQPGQTANSAYNYIAINSTPTHMQAQSIYTPVTQTGDYKVYGNSPQSITNQGVISTSQTINQQETQGTITSTNKKVGEALSDQNKIDSTSKKDTNSQQNGQSTPAK